MLSNNNIDLELSEIATSLGIIRQIYDDFNDYFDEHHEPFGDFITRSNRLPELLFKKNKGNRGKVLKYLEKNNYKKARENVLNLEVRRELYNFCNREVEKINKIKTNFNYSNLVVNFKEILIKK